jgi:type II secretory pathway component GspD/PulD (secretin)
VVLLVAAARQEDAAATNAKVVAVADERTNSLVISAPEDVIPIIEKLVFEIDVNVSDVTEVRVFHLVNADPVEMAGIFSELFPDTSRTGEQQNTGFRFGGGPFGGGGAFARGGGGNRGNQGSDESEREKKKGRVVAVPDPRTSSLIVTAASELMPQISEMIAQLDSSPARKQKVYIYSLENADVQQVEQVVRDMFERTSVQGNRNNLQNQNSALQNRSRQQQNQQGIGGGLRNGGLGNAGIGGGGTGTFR